MKNFLKISLLFLVLSNFGCQKKIDSDFPFTDDKTEYSEDELSKNELREVIEGGVVWFKNVQEESGHFLYEYNPFTDSFTEDDNIVRQAGSFYSLGEIYYHDEDNSLDLKDTLIRSAKYFEDISVVGQLNDNSFICIKTTKTKCSIGATGLALIGLLDLVEKSPDLDYEFSDQINGYRNFLLAMKVPDLGFRGKYSISGEQSLKETPFANGEAWLALVRYHLYDPKHNEVSYTVEEAWKYFKDLYIVDLDNNFYLWGMAAIKDLYSLDPRQEYFDFVWPYTDSRIARFSKKRNSVHNYCAYIEGVTSAYSVIRDNVSKEEREEYLEEINYWLTKTSELQIVEDQYKVKYENELKYKKRDVVNIDQAYGGFLTGFDSPVQRIDFTQHCINSYLQKLVDIDKKDL